MINLTGEQWERYEDKYGKLMWTIARKISGDDAISAIEDNRADLCQTALESINAFNKKTGASFDEMMLMKLFDQYTKTCLWHKKANKGKKIKNRYLLTNNTVSASENPDLLAQENSKAAASFDLKEDLNKVQKIIIDLIVKDPSIILDTGRVNISEIARLLGLSYSVASKHVQTIANKIRNVL